MTIIRFFKLFFYFFFAVKNIKDNLPYIILNLIPKPVLNTFLARLAREKTATANVTTPPNYQDKIAGNLLLTLMEFQKQGIEYVMMSL